MLHRANLPFRKQRAAARDSFSQNIARTSGGLWRSDLAAADYTWRCRDSGPSRSRRIDSCSLYVLNRRMSMILQINRDFPFQVALSFDEAAMDVLDWLDGCAFEWDMYVDLPENTIRYCFRTLADASAFKSQFGDALEECVAAAGY
jgi:hypothetical protein